MKEIHLNDTDDAIEMQNWYIRAHEPVSVYNRWRLVLKIIIYVARIYHRERSAISYRNPERTCRGRTHVRGYENMEIAR